MNKYRCDSIDTHTQGEVGSLSHSLTGEDIYCCTSHQWEQTTLKNSENKDYRDNKMTVNISDSDSFSNCREVK